MHPLFLLYVVAEACSAVIWRRRLAHICDFGFPKLGRRERVFNDSRRSAHESSWKVVIFDKDAQTSKSAIAEENPQQDKSDDDDEERYGCKGETDERDGKVSSDESREWVGGPPIRARWVSAGCRGGATLLCLSPLECKAGSRYSRGRLPDTRAKNGEGGGKRRGKSLY